VFTVAPPTCAGRSQCWMCARGAATVELTTAATRSQASISTLPRLPLDMWLAIMSFVRLSDMYPR
jgi:hypothetical protein